MESPPILAPDHLIDWIGGMEGDRGVRALSDREGPERGGMEREELCIQGEGTQPTPSLRGNS